MSGVVSTNDFCSHARYTRTAPWQDQISELTRRWTAVASEMRPYQSDLGENALLKDENLPVYEPVSADPHEQVVDEGDSVAGQ